MTPCIEWPARQRNHKGYGRAPLGPPRVDAAGRRRGRRLVLVHRWIVELIDGKPLAPGEIVMHLCDNPPCYRYSHLRRATQADNLTDMGAKGRARYNYGDQHHNAKITNDDAEAIRDSVCSGPELARRYGVSTSLIKQIRSGKVRSKRGKHMNDPHTSITTAPDDTIDLADATPNSLSEALHDAARIEALGDLVAERRAKLRDYIGDGLQAIAHETGGAPRVSNKGVAQAFITEPRPILEITDEAAYHQYLREKLPNMIRGVERVRVDKVQEILANDPVLAELFREQGALEVEYLTDDTLPAELAQWSRTDRDKIVDPDGEPVPGVRIIDRPGSLVVRVDKDFRTRLLDAARDRAKQLARDNRSRP